MGFNTVSLTLNDCSHDIERSPNLGQVFGRAMASGRGSDHEVNGLRILPSQHADVLQLVVAGGNTIKPVASFFMPRGFTFGRGDDIAEEALKLLADDLGYNLSKKAWRKRQDAAQRIPSGTAETALAGSVHG